MNADRWRQIVTILAGALERNGDDRAAFVEKACAGDAALRGEVESLLAQERAAASFLERPVGTPLLSSDDATTATILARDHLRSDADGVTGVSGRILGPYRIERLLGRGGMGAVYAAEERQTGRRVALKVLQHTSPLPSERARFLREGRLAASVNHPNVVYIFGAAEI